VLPVVNVAEDVCDFANVKLAGELTVIVAELQELSMHELVGKLAGLAEPPPVAIVA
jgi:hypothetical protein